MLIPLLRRPLFSGLALLTTLTLIALATLTQPGAAELPRQGTIVSLQPANQVLSAPCKQVMPNATGTFAPSPAGVDSQQIGGTDNQVQSPRSFREFQPRQQIALADATNYGPRFSRDIRGRAVSNAPIVVLHETVGSAAGTIGFFQTPHPRDDDQASYHALITLGGTIVYLVPPQMRAFGAGNSVFRSPRGVEAVQTNPKFPASVNNFAYHISLETPADGIHNGSRHSGYTREQYESLGWLVAKTGVSDERITTHRLVDRSGSRLDPRSFNFNRFKSVLNRYPRQDEIGLACAVQPSNPVNLENNLPPTQETDGNGVGL